MCYFKLFCLHAAVLASLVGSPCRTIKKCFILKCLQPVLLRVPPCVFLRGFGIADYHWRRNYYILSSEKKNPGKGRVTLQQFNPTQHRKKTCNCNQRFVVSNFMLYDFLYLLPKIILQNKRKRYVIIVSPMKRTKNQPEVFLHKVFLRPPRVMDIRAFGSRTSAQKTCFSCAPSDGVKVSGWDVRPDIRPDVREISRPKNLCLGCFSIPDNGMYFWEKWQGDCEISRHQHWKIASNESPPDMDQVLH